MRSVLILTVTSAVLLAACSDDGDARPDGGPVVSGPDATAMPIPDASPTRLDATPVTADGGSRDATPVAEDAQPGSDDASEPARDAGPQGSMDASTGGPHAMMSFFVTSEGSGANGGNLGGLAGADAWCQRLATAVGRGGKTWRAYLSTSSNVGGGGSVVHARDRIGAGPWLNYAGTTIAANVDALHATPPSRTLLLTESGGIVPGMEHDILTGSDPDGRAFDGFPGNPAAPAPTCGNWTDGTDASYGWVGHSDWDSGAAATHWSSVHGSMCSPTGLASTAGSGHVYCFAID